MKLCSAKQQKSSVDESPKPELVYVNICFCFFFVYLQAEARFLRPSFGNSRSEFSLSYEKDLVERSKRTCCFSETERSAALAWGHTCRCYIVLISLITRCAFPLAVSLRDSLGRIINASVQYEVPRCIVSPYLFLEQKEGVGGRGRRGIVHNVILSPKGSGGPRPRLSV